MDSLDFCLAFAFMGTVTHSYFVLVCSLYFLFGNVCTFYGYRCFKMIMFLYGFIFGSIVVYLICAEENVLPGIQIVLLLLLVLILYNFGTIPGFAYGAQITTSPFF